MDWLEWQACYFSGAIPMPRTAMISLVREYADGIRGAPRLGSEPAGQLIVASMNRFQVSRDAARVRLQVLGLLREAASPA